MLPPQVHAAIRENPIIEKKARSKPSDAQKWKATKLSYDERKAALKVFCASQLVHNRNLRRQWLHTCRLVVVTAEHAHAHRHFSACRCGALLS